MAYEASNGIFIFARNITWFYVQCELSTFLKKLFSDCLIQIYHLCQFCTVFISKTGHNAAYSILSSSIRKEMFFKNGLLVVSRPAKLGLLVIASAASKER